MPPASVIRAAQSFGVQPLTCLQAHPVSDVWRVSLPDGETAVLKLYHNGMGNEAAGFAYLDQFQGQSAVRIYAIKGDVVLMEDLPGPSLGDLARSGKDHEAAVLLADVAQRLRADAKRTPGLKPLSDVFRPMLETSAPDGFSSDQRHVFAAGCAIAQELLQRETDAVPLHGDLHHDNVLKAGRGYCAFDAKGMWGDPAYELANAFRHPRKRPDVTTDVGRVCRIAPLWADALGVSPRHLLSWAMAKVTLSVFWQAQAGAPSDLEFQHYTAFSTAREQF